MSIFKNLFAIAYLPPAGELVVPEMKEADFHAGNVSIDDMLVVEEIYMPVTVTQTSASQFNYVETVTRTTGTAQWERVIANLGTIEAQKRFEEQMDDLSKL